MSDSLFLLALPIQPHLIVVENVTTDMLADEENELFMHGGGDRSPATPLGRSLSCGTPVFRTANNRVCVPRGVHFSSRTVYYTLQRVRFLDEQGNVRAFTLSKLTEDTPLLPGAIIVQRMSVWIYESSNSGDIVGYALTAGSGDGQIAAYSIRIPSQCILAPDAHVLLTVPCMADYELK